MRKQASGVYGARTFQVHVKKLSYREAMWLPKVTQEQTQCLNPSSDSSLILRPQSSCTINALQSTPFTRCGYLKLVFPISWQARAIYVPGTKLHDIFLSTFFSSHDIFPWFYIHHSPFFFMVLILESTPYSVSCL